MIEIIVIVAIIGIMAMTAAPSFGALLESVKVDQSVAEIRGELAATQRSAIRGGQSCMASMLVQMPNSTLSFADFQAKLLNTCSSEESARILPKGVSVVSNLVSETGVTVARPSSSDPILVASAGLKMGNDLGSDWFMASGKGPHDDAYWDNWYCEKWDWCNASEGSSPPPNQTVVEMKFGSHGTVDYQVETAQSPAPDPTGKVVVFSSKHPQRKQRCIAISKRIGLTRVGVYRGELFPSNITDSGICTALDWKKQ